MSAPNASQSAKLSKNKRKKMQRAGQALPAQPTAVLVVNQPTKKTKTKRNKAKSVTNKTRATASGVDVLGQLDVTSEVAAGTVLSKILISPVSLSGSRLETEATLWQRWRPVSMKLEITSSCSSAVSGSYGAAWVADPNEVASERIGVAQLVGWGTTRQVKFFQNLHLNVPCDPSRAWYTKKGDSFDDSHGAIVVMVVSPVSTTKTTLVVKLHWRINFDGPDLPHQTVDYPDIFPRDGWVKIFTDSVSTWAGGARLTFKMHEGGDVVPWSNLIPGVVYSPKSGVKITAFTSDSKEEEITFFSPIRGSLFDGLACHSSQAYAENYQKTGNLAYVMKYYRASSIATPEKPEMKYVTHVTEKSQLHLFPDLPDRNLEPSSSVLSKPDSPKFIIPQSDLDYIAARVAQILQQRATDEEESGGVTPELLDFEEEGRASTSRLTSIDEEGESGLSRISSDSGNC